MSSVIALQSSIAHHMICTPGSTTQSLESPTHADNSVHDTAKPTCITTADRRRENRLSGSNHISKSSSNNLNTCASIFSAKTRSSPVGVNVLNGSITGNTPPLLNFENRNACVHSHKHRSANNTSPSLSSKTSLLTQNKSASLDNPVVKNTSMDTGTGDSGRVSPIVGPKLTNGPSALSSTKANSQSGAIDTLSMTGSEVDSCTSSLNTASSKADNDVCTLVKGFTESMVTNYQIGDAPGTLAIMLDRIL